MRTTDEIGTDKVDVIVDHLHQINFLNKYEVEIETNILTPDYITTYYLLGPNIFDYVTLKGPDDVMYYAFFEDENRNNPEKFCKVEVRYIDDCAGNNVVSLSFCRDPFKDYTNLINEIEKVTGDKYIAEEEWY